MKKSWIVGAIIIVVLAIITYLNFTYNWGILQTGTPDKGSTEFTDTCKDIPPKNFSTCIPGTHNCTIQFDFEDRDQCYQSLAIKDRNIKICDMIDYNLRKNECLSVMNSLINESSRSDNPEYLEVLSFILKANKYVVDNNLNDACFPYRYIHLGCIHGETKDYLIASDLKEFNLTIEERLDLCNKFAHKGAIAYCLKSNNELQKCLDLSANNTYLNRVCRLTDNQVIPSQAFGPYEGDTTYSVDSYQNAPLVKYSELI
jgi:hypothetical protein